MVLGFGAWGSSDNLRSTAVGHSGFRAFVFGFKLAFNFGISVTGALRD